MTKKLNALLAIFMVLSMVLALAAPQGTAKAAPVTFSILHTNDFHGQLEASGSNPGLARVAAYTKSLSNVLLVDAGDEMQGSLLSNIQKGAPVIEAFNNMGYAVATLGNHEFDWGQQVLGDRTTQAAYPYVSANIVSGTCDASNWALPTFVDAPYTVVTVAGIKVAFIGVTTTEVPTITLAANTAGLCFKDPADSILHYYDQMKAESDVIVVLSHLGLNDGGYGYGIPVYGDKTLATKLNAANKPVAAIIGGHSHTNMMGLTPPGAVTVGSTVIAQAYYNGRQVGKFDFTVDTAVPSVSVTWSTQAISTSGAVDPGVNTIITNYASDPTYQATINQPVGYTQVDLLRDYNGDAMMGNFVDDAIYNALNSDTEPTNDVDLFFNNAGGIRIDWCDKEEPVGSGTYIWSSTAADCQKEGLWTHDPMLLNYGQMFQILPFGNATVVGDMTGAQILQVLNQSATLAKGAIQPSGIQYKFYSYRNIDPAATQPAPPNPPITKVYAWGAYDACVVNKTTGVCEPLDMKKTYRVGTNEFLAPAGGDLYGGFKYMKNITYWGDMLDAVNSYVSATYTQTNPYKGPDGDGTLDGRITRDGTDAPDSGSIIPITILHHNDSHGNLVKGQYVGYTQLATLIKQERTLNPARTLLLSGGDNIQGDAMMYYYKSAPSGFAADGTVLPADLQTHPLIKAFNAMGYDAVDLGNHEFNFGSQIFQGIFGQATFPVLGANVSDSGAYGLAAANVQPYVEKDLGGIKVGIMGITNHRVPNYELPSNIPGLTFSDPIAKAEELSTTLNAQDDVVIALTHIGFTEDPKSVEVDKNVDTNLAATVNGIDAIIGAHSHTNPATGFGDYKFLPTFVADPEDQPVIINQAYRYNNTLGEVVLGVRKNAEGKYEVMTRAGQYISVTTSIAEDAEIKGLIDPYVAQLNSYYNKEVGQTTEPIDTLKAYTEETNGANLQADAAVWELAKNGITDVDFHLSGAMTNKLMAAGATPEAPVTLKISDMFAGMPYENSLVVLQMNGPQLKAVLERAYRNYYYYKYVPGYGGYSYYTTCMIDINKIGRIYYKDTYPAAYDATQSYVMGLVINGKPVDFNDATKYYNVSTVNYLAAGSCNFNDAGKSLWPLDQIVHDTQFYVRDAVIDYITAMGTVSPKIEGRLLFGDTVAPVVTINAPLDGNTYLHPQIITIDVKAEDGVDGTTPATAPPSGVQTLVVDVDGAVMAKTTLDMSKLSLGSHVLTATATDYYGNATTVTATFTVTATIQSLKDSVNRFAAEKKWTASTKALLMAPLNAASGALKAKNLKIVKAQLNTFISTVKTMQMMKKIDKDTANWLVNDARYVLSNPK